MLFAKATLIANSRASIQARDFFSVTFFTSRLCCVKYRGHMDQQSKSIHSDDHLSPFSTLHRNFKCTPDTFHLWLRTVCKGMRL